MLGGIGVWMRSGGWSGRGFHREKVVMFGNAHVCDAATSFS